MKSILKAFSVIALAGAFVLPVMADDTDSTTDAKDTKDLKKVIEDQGINYVETAQKGITLSGYVDVSYTNQFAGRGQEFDQSSNTGNQHSIRSFDNNADGFNVQAVKIALEKALPDKNEWAAGFRVDAILGSDARNLGDSAFGNSSSSSSSSRVSTSYPIALEQALVKARIPVGNGLDIYAGKFVTFLGYEVIESPANLNFSRGLLFTALDPLTHTGVYADYKFNDTVEAKFGVVDSITPNSTSSAANAQGGTYGSDRQNDYPFGGKAITGQVNVTAPGKNANVCTSFIYSPSGQDGWHDNGPQFDGDIWGNWNPTFVKDSALTLGFDISYDYVGDTGTPTYQQGVPYYYRTPNEGGAGSSAEGVALYASYKLSKVVTLSARGEYVHGDSRGTQYYNNGTVFGNGGYYNTSTGRFDAGSSNAFSETLTVAFNIWDNLLTRAEYRLDDIDGNAYGDGKSHVENEVSLEAVYSF